MTAEQAIKNTRKCVLSRIDHALEQFKERTGFFPEDVTHGDAQLPKDDPEACAIYGRWCAWMLMYNNAERFAQGD